MPSPPCTAFLTDHHTLKLVPFVDPTDARNKFIDPAVTVATAAGHSSRLSADVPEVFRQLVTSAVLGPVLG